MSALPGTGRRRFRRGEQLSVLSLRWAASATAGADGFNNPEQATRLAPPGLHVVVLLLGDDVVVGSRWDLHGLFE